MILMPTIALAGAERSIKLPPPPLKREGTLLQALQSRRSTREFALRSLPLDLLGTLLWAAFGVNRPATADAPRLRRTTCRK
jgi:hypothetical protein